MREEQLYSLLIQLLAQGASLEEQTREGQRFVLCHAGALALKLVREGRVRARCKMRGHTLWFGV
ncbi:MAG: hypothetical protein AB1412_04055 [Pseudomonadota bacterium]